MKHVECVKCHKLFLLSPKKEAKYNADSLCGKCRSKQRYNRKVSACPKCGKPILRVSRYCNRCSQLGNKNHQWKEEKKDRKVYDTADWKLWRDNVLERDNHICRMCGEIFGRLTAHHILPKRDYPELLYDVNNGITLCLRCHSEIHFKEEDYADYFLELLDIRPNQNSVNSVNPEMGIPSQA